MTPRTHALLTSLSIVALAASATLTSGCVSMIAGIGCLAAPNGCAEGTMSSAAQADAMIAGGIAQAAIDSARAEAAAEARATAEPMPPPPPYVGATPLVVVVPPPEPTLVDIAVTGDAPREISVYLPRGDEPEPRRQLAGACAPPCTLSLLPATYAFSVGGYALQPQIDIPAVPRRSVRLDVDSREEERLWGWGFIGLSIAALAGFTVAIAELDIDQTEVVLPTTLGLFGLLITGIVLAILPDDVRPTLVF